MFNFPHFTKWNWFWMWKMYGYFHIITCIKWIDLGVQERNIIYLDKIWATIGHTVLKECKDKFIITTEDALLYGLTTGLQTPITRDMRIVLLHVGGRERFVKVGSCFFLPKQIWQTTTQWWIAIFLKQLKVQFCLIFQ